MRTNDNNRKGREASLVDGAEPSGALINEGLVIHRIYQQGKYLSLKVDSYFQVYEELFRDFVGKPVVFVEVGVLNGGSLFMWREYFGPQARIIGVDLNPAAKRWESEGFEIHIGSQSDPNFWKTFFTQIGDIDVLLDDGGHTNAQQIVTTAMALPHVRNGGLVVVEDTHASYMSEFGNPSKYSFDSFAKRIVDSVNSRYSGIKTDFSGHQWLVYNVQFFQSIVAFRIDRRRCFISKPVRNEGVNSSAQDFRYRGTSRENVHYAKLRLAEAFPKFAPMIRLLFILPERILAGIENRRMRQYFE